MSGAGAAGPPPVLPPRYEVRKFLGQGAMGRVFLCKDAELDVIVAIKVLAPHLAADPAAIEMVRTEARAVARFRGCPSILALYGFEQHEGSWFLVMEFAAGGALDERLKKEGRFPEAECRRIGAEVAEALAFAHRHKVLHRDIKPANILLDGDGLAKVADFGIAKVLHPEQESTSTLSLAGTPVYMPPEAILRGNLDGRSDLYSLGCMLYEMAAGVRPFKGPIDEIFRLKAEEMRRVPDPRELVPEISEAYAAIIHRATAPDPKDRFPDGATMAAALRDGAAPSDGHVATVVQERPRTALPPTPAAPRSKVPLIAACLLLLVGGVAFAVLSGDKPPATNPKEPEKKPDEKKPDEKKPEEKEPDEKKPEEKKVEETPKPPVPSPDPPPSDPPFAFAVKRLPPLPEVPKGLRLPTGFAVRDGRIACLKDRAEMVLVPAGPFKMGSAEEDEDERPPREITLPAYLIDRHEVTVAQYREYCGETGTAMPAQKGPDDGPVVGVDWDAARNYARWAGKRLPTEAEWERAARGTDARRFPWGDEASASSCNAFAARDDNYAEVAPCGKVEGDRSPVGCVDMGGNVSEWCEDWYDQHAYEKKDPAPGDKRVVRGGHWDWKVEMARAARRGNAPPTRGAPYLGFRCAASAGE